MYTEYGIFIRWVLVNMRSSFHQMNANILYLTSLRFYFTLLSLDRGLFIVSSYSVINNSKRYVAGDIGLWPISPSQEAS